MMFTLHRVFQMRRRIAPPEFQNVLREEIKEKLKWSVDRSSPSNKIRDLMRWSKDILKDIYYQRRILSNWICAFLTKHWCAQLRNFTSPNSSHHNGSLIRITSGQS